MKRSKFSLSNDKLLSFNPGQLVPCGLTEVLPGDSIQQATSALVRVSPLLSPVMHPVHVRIHHWFVPHRLVWDNGKDDSWEAFITGGHDGMDASVFPTVTAGGGGFAIGSLADYLGCPTGVASLEVNALPFRAVNLIINEWYRDQDLVTERVIDKTGGADTTTDLTMFNVAWEKDYFTSARPWPQKGPEVTLPISGTAPVTGIGVLNGTFGATNLSSREADGTTHVYPIGVNINNDTNNLNVKGSHATTGFPEIFANLSEATGIPVNDLRLALALQRYEENRARFGSRYTEYLRFLGVRSSDARLQRPEYLGGGKQTIQFSEVLQTGVDTDDTGVGNLRGHGIGAMRSNRYRRFFEEHGYIISFISVKPKTVYGNGLFRTWNRRIKEDFWQKELEHIGQQEVLNKEVYAGHATPNGVFGYQDRYDEYRRAESTIAGEFRDTLDYWHYARIFDSNISLNAAFVTSDPTDRVYADPSDDVLYVMVHHSIQARRLVTPTGTSFIY